MSIWELLLLAVGLSMDAFAISISKGLSAKEVKLRHYFIIGGWFGGFQALMPLIGYFLASLFSKYIAAFDHWIAFALLVLLGANMIREAFSKSEEDIGDSFGVKSMLLLSLAGSIDALATGVALCLDGVNIWLAISVIGATTFIFSAVGLRVGQVFGKKFKTKAEVVGGIILILIGVKILLQHLGVINF